MNILVYCIAAESGGALSVLIDYYNKSKNDSNNNYVFLVSVVELKEQCNIIVEKVPWIKKSLFHRVFFELFKARKIVKNRNIDKIYSLQNTTVLFTKTRQEIFVHNALPFSKHKFNIFFDTYLWFYQNVIGRNIIRSINHASKVVVQTSWMKDEILSKCKIDENNIIVEEPVVNIDVTAYNNKSENEINTTFFYPANGMKFKNHQVVVSAVSKIDCKYYNDFEIIFTISPNENKNISRLSNICCNNGFPISFVGHKSKDYVYKKYNESILLFPSFIETVGLPILEAKCFNANIIVAEAYYSKNLLVDYQRVDFFDHLDSDELSKLILKHIKK